MWSASPKRGKNKRTEYGLRGANLVRGWLNFLILNASYVPNEKKVNVEYPLRPFLFSIYISILISLLKFGKNSFSKSSDLKNFSFIFKHRKWPDYGLKFLVEFQNQSRHIMPYGTGNTVTQNFSGAEKIMSHHNLQKMRRLQLFGKILTTFRKFQTKLRFTLFLFEFEFVVIVFLYNEMSYPGKPILFIERLSLDWTWYKLQVPSLSNSQWLKMDTKMN